ncbi:MAG: hypothetical protein OEX22_04985 [Cyclobacteriaceae bacterium]|nr:hypothetical protein [Cyclobacteriaceae bacterium]
MKKINGLRSIWVVLILSACGGDEASFISPISSTSGQGGSLARFAIGGNHLYTINDFSIKIFDVSGRTDIVYKKDVDVGFGIETLFPVGQNLFIGAQDGMYIYDITSPDSPQQLSYYSHFVSCDPVVVQDNLAYVTLRVSECRPSQSWDALEIIDISNLSNPIQISSYPLDSPYGLGISGNTLFICEGNNGLKVLDVSDPRNIKVITQFSGIHAYDVIPTQQILIVTGNTGIRQYDFSDPQNITLISELYSIPG